jgi:ADP-ribose pyrophosphatase YjhB (NUDIX family)
MPHISASAQLSNPAEGILLPYAQDLRTVVGSRPLILVAAGVLICNAAGDLLLQRRTDDRLWGIPGGSMELGESAEETARREVQEETGLAVGDVRLFAVFSGPEMYHVYPNGDQVAIVSIVFLANPVPGQVPTPGDESLELRYFTRDTLPTIPLSAPNRPIIRHFLENDQARGF